MKGTVIVSAGAGLAGLVLAAGLTVFTEETAFIAALDIVEKNTFETAALGSVLENTIVDLGNLTFRYNGFPDGGQGDPFLGQPLFQDIGIGVLDIQFMGEVNADGSPSGLHFFDIDDPVYGFGGNFISATSGARLTLTAAGQTVRISDFLPGKGTGFFGFVSTTPFQTVEFGVEATTDPSIGKSSEVFRLDDITTGIFTDPPPDPDPVPAPVPLPGGLASLVLGLAALGLWRRISGPAAV